MGENATKIGAKLEGWGSSLFQDFCWTELARDLEIKCNRKATHEDKQTHGIDLLFSLFDPYLKLRQGIIVECKNRQMQSINQTEINKWIQELQNSIECPGLSMNSQYCTEEKYRKRICIAAVEILVFINCKILRQNSKALIPKCLFSCVSIHSALYYTCGNPQTATAKQSPLLSP